MISIWRTSLICHISVLLCLVKQSWILKETIETYSIWQGVVFASTVRLAKSNPVTWTAIFKENQQEVQYALEEYIQNLKAFQKQLETQNYRGIHQQLAEVNDLKPILNGIIKKEENGN